MPPLRFFDFFAAVGEDRSSIEARHEAPVKHQVDRRNYLSLFPDTDAKHVHVLSVQLTHAFVILLTADENT